MTKKWKDIREAVAVIWKHLFEDGPHSQHKFGSQNKYSVKLLCGEARGMDNAEDSGMDIDADNGQAYRPEAWTAPYEVRGLD